MPDRITDPPPADVAGQLAALSAAFDQVIPPEQAGQNLLIGTWNVRAFDRLTPKDARSRRRVTGSLPCSMGPPGRSAAPWPSGRNSGPRASRFASDCTPGRSNCGETTRPGRGDRFAG